MRGYHFGFGCVALAVTCCRPPLPAGLRPLEGQVDVIDVPLVASRTEVSFLKHGRANQKTQVGEYMVSSQWAQSGHGRISISERNHDVVSFDCHFRTGSHPTNPRTPFEFATCSDEARHWLVDVDYGDKCKLRANIGHSLYIYTEPYSQCHPGAAIALHKGGGKVDRVTNIPEPGPVIAGLILEADRARLVVPRSEPEREVAFSLLVTLLADPRAPIYGWP